MKCIIAGLGHRGLEWISEVNKHDDIEIAAYVEPAEPCRQRAIADYGVPAGQMFTSLQEALEKAPADFLLNVTPPAVHHEIAAIAFNNGLHVLCEKPLSDNFATAKKVVEQGKDAGLKHMVTQDFRFTAQPRTTRPLIEEGLIGTPGQCDVRFYMPWADIPNSHYVNEPYMFINDMMVHHFDMMRFVLGQTPVSVQAITWNQPWGWHKGDAAHVVVFHYADGLVATHTSCGCAVGSQTSWNGDWRIEGPNGTLEWDKTGGITYSHLWRTEAPIEKTVELKVVPDGAQAILTEFTAAIREDREPECSAEDNLNSLAMVFAAIQSVKEGRAVKLSGL